MTAPAYLDGVLSQPATLAASAAVVRAALAGPVGPAALAALGSGRVVVLGIGASFAAAAGFAAELRGAGRAALAVNPADLGTVVPAGLADAYLAISQSGRSRETVETLAAAGRAVAGAAAAGRRVALTNDPASPLAAVADVVLPLGCGEDTRVSTLSYTATVQALGLLADALAGRDPAGTASASLPDLAAELLAVDPGPLVDALAGMSTVDVVGSGVRAASAVAAALLLREAAHLPTAGYLTREYLHGHLEVAGAGHGALLFGSGREVSLAAELAGLGSAVVLVTDDAPPFHPGLHTVRVPALTGLAGCVLDILPVQVAAHRLAERAGRPIELRHMPSDTKLPATPPGPWSNAPG